MIEPTHEEMLEVAAESEEVTEFLDVVAEETFSNLGEQDFFDPNFYKEEIRYPAQPAGQAPMAPVPPPKRRPRYILRAETRRRKG
jgi:hypothetical protein